jgi:hypothetical protein
MTDLCLSDPIILSRLHFKPGAHIAAVSMCAAGGSGHVMAEVAGRGEMMTVAARQRFLLAVVSRVLEVSSMSRSQVLATRKLATPLTTTILACKLNSSSFSIFESISASYLKLLSVIDHTPVVLLISSPPASACQQQRCRNSGTLDVTS